MLNFFKKKNKEVIESSLAKIAALLIHVAKIDENYTQKEREIIKKAITKLSSKNEIIDKVLIKAEEIEKNSNQILDFTREVKNMNEESSIEGKLMIERLALVIHWVPFLFLLFAVFFGLIIQ